MDIDLTTIVDSLSDGVYVCDLQRRITYWSKSAERITGWTAADVLGLQCFDNVLCHIDKDGHLLCGQEYCPLHRSMITGTGSSGSLLVFAQSKRGERIPMLVSVAPLRNAAGDVIGGVETFQDASDVVHDLERAKAIQQLALHHDLPEDSRIKFTTHYVPQAIVGGDYYAIERLGEDRYGLMLADVMGHGIAAALYTMHLSSLWNRHRSLLCEPAEFAAKLNNELVKVVKTDESFATAVCGLIDLQQGVFRFAGAGGPQVLRMRADATYECFETAGLPLAIMDDAQYDEVRVDLQAGDRLLLFSDGALEISNAAGEMLGLEGLIGLLKKQGYPAADLRMETLEEDLLKYSNCIRLSDDLTLIEIRIGG
jgi:phosphoserine phosphatase RsbU/P